MKRVVGRVFFAALAILLVALGTSYVGDRNAGARGLADPAADRALIERGAYLAKVGDCAACHSVSGQPPFSGGLRMVTPIGAIYTTNITPDKTRGIGRFTLVDFDRALRYGVAEGHTLYPAMPYTSYFSTTPDDVAALYAYFKYAVAPASVPNRTSEIVFPLSMRWPLTYWRWLYASRPVPFTPRGNMDAETARGAYLVEGLGHCGECHTPRAVTLNLKALSPGDGLSFLSGAVVDHYWAPSLRSANPGSLKDWTADDIATFLTSGTTTGATAFASMSEVIGHSSQYFATSDALAVARYLKTLHDANEGPSAPFKYDASTHQALAAGDISRRGAILYLDNCAACHRSDGRGYERVFPALAGNPIVEAAEPSSVVAIVLRGAQTPRTASATAQFVMPPFDWRLSDQAIADVLTFIRSSWGNQARALDPGAVANLRRRLAASNATGTTPGG